MFRTICMALALCFAMNSHGIAAEKDFSWDDESITSSGRSSASGRNWSNEDFQAGSAPSSPSGQDADSRRDLTWGDGIDEPAPSPKAEGKRDLTWGDGFDEPEGSRKTDRATAPSWGDGIDAPESNGNADSRRDLTWGDGIDEPAPSPKAEGKRDLTWGDGFDEPEGSRKADRAPDYSGSDGPGGVQKSNGESVSTPQAAKKTSGATKLVMLVVDRDKAGTNVRDAPSGKKIGLIPLHHADEVRTVVVSGASAKGWFELAPGGMADQGWMHRSVLGICAGANGKGGADAHIEPSTDAPSVKIPAGIPLTPMEMHGDWLLVRLGMGKSKTECWIRTEDLLLDDGELEDCAQTWSQR